MLEITRIRNDREGVLEGLKNRFIDDAENLVGKVISLDDRRKEIQQEQDEQLNKRNKLAKSIGQLMKEGKKEEAESAKAETGALKENIRKLEEEGEKVKSEIREILLNLPNVPEADVPVGKLESDNVVAYRNDREVSLPADAKAHWDLCVEKGIVDWELGAKLTGSGFPVYIGKGAKLQRALIRFFLEKAEAEGYTEIQPPLVVNADSGMGTGQLPDKEGQMYHITMDELYLIPTAEVPITNLYRDVILKEDQLPVKNCGYTPCFRREAGAHGSQVRGLNRLHQFDKVEIVQVTHPEESYKTLDEMVSYVKGLLEELELPFRVLSLCTGDLGFTSAKTYDMEVYSAAQERWLEVSSISNFETFQANRLKLRYRGADGKNRLAHTLNGSALALPRIFAALVENNQQEDGRIITIPKALQPYTGFEFI